MKFTAENLSFGELYAALKQKHVSVEMYESVNALLSDTDLSLKPEYCFEITNGSLIVLIDHNKELLLAVDITSNGITNIQADTIDAATIANDAIEIMLEQAKYYGEESFYPEREEYNDEYADETYNHDFNA